MVEKFVWIIGLGLSVRCIVNWLIIVKGIMFVELMMEVRCVIKVGLD